MNTDRPAVVLTVAGSDPSGGAGIQADLKTFCAFGVYGCAVPTALTAQSTRGVTDVHPVPPDFVLRQLDTLLEDVPVDAVKVGMLGSAAVAHVVMDRLEQWQRDRPDGRLVLDPVMVSTSGSSLLPPDAVAVVRDRGPGLGGLLTPNLPEAALLLGSKQADTVTAMRDQATALAGLGPGAILLKGGHLPGVISGEVTDVLAAGHLVHEFRGPAVATSNTHGTGCTLSSAVAASAARTACSGTGTWDGWAPHVEAGRAYLVEALRAGAGWRLGAGPGPVDHLLGRGGPCVEGAIRVSRGPQVRPRG